MSPLAVLSLALPLGLALCGLLAVPFLLHFRAEQAHARENAQEDEERVVELASQAIVQEIAGVLADLRFLSEQNALQDFLREPSPANRERLAAEYLAFVGQKQRYDQARFIGADGWEQVRVNANGGRPSVVPAGKLQHKGDRDYVQEAMRLGRGRIHVSPLDLNVEQGVVERPARPMLRASLPLFAPDGERRGILTLSYLGTQLLGRLGAIAGAGPSELWLLNGEGYWLVGPDPDLEWAFMSPDRSDRAMAVRYPGAWARLATEVTGTFAMEAGLLTFRRVYPLTADLPTAHARGLAIPATPQRYFWIVATLLPGEVLAGRSGTLFRDLALGYSMLALLTLVAALGVSYLSARGRALVQVMTRVVDNVPDLISYIDASQHYRFTNRAYHRLFGLSPEAIYGRTVRDLLGDAAYAAIRPHLERALRGERVSFETRVHYSGPGLREVSVTYVPDLGAGGEVRGLFVVVNDITRLKDAERRERERTLEVAHSARLASVGEMATQIAHEVNQPLTAIVTYCAAALRSVQGGAPDPSRLREWVSAISDEAQRVSEIVRRLRQFVRRGEMVRAPLDLGEVVGEVVSMVQPEASHKGVTLVVDGAPALPAVLADRILIAQAILNLLRNALDAVAGEPPDRRRVTVSTTIDGDRVEVTVADSGPGVGPGVGGQLFESFVTTKPDGLGMGLSITRSIVEAHGGQVRHAPAPGGGAMFSFSLPRTQG